MKKIFFLMLGLPALLLTGADLDIISNRRSEYKIVYADKELYPFHNRYSSIAANTLQTVLRHATGAVLKVLPESKFDGKGKAIFLGSTDAVRKAGLAPARYRRWEHRIDVKGQNIYLHGMDWRNASDPKAGYRQRYVLGSHKAMLTFLEKFTGADAPKKLSKIGGQDFASVKAKVKESVKKLAFNLSVGGIKG